MKTYDISISKEELMFVVLLLLALKSNDEVNFRHLAHDFHNLTRGIAQRKFAFTIGNLLSKHEELAGTSPGDMNSFWKNEAFKDKDAAEYFRTSDGVDLIALQMEEVRKHNASGCPFGDDEAYTGAERSPMEEMLDSISLSFISPLGIPLGNPRQNLN